jgi:ClpP class serine protease
MVDQIDLNKRDGIVDGRNTKGFDPMVWKMIRKHGSFTGEQALKLGLVDHLPKLSPLGDLLKSNLNGNKAAMAAKWGDETDMTKFTATGQISFEQYRSFVAKVKPMFKRKSVVSYRANEMCRVLLCPRVDEAQT